MSNKRKMNGSPDEVQVAKAVRQVTDLTTGNVRANAQEARDATVRTIVRMKGRPVGEPRVYITVEQDFARE